MTVQEQLIENYNKSERQRVHDYVIAPINIEGKLNAMHFKKGWKRRFVVREIDGVLHVTLSNNGLVFEQALYVIKEKKLYAISGVFQLHWAAIRRVFREEYKTVKIIGHVPS